MTLSVSPPAHWHLQILALLFVQGWQPHRDGVGCKALEN